MFNESKIRHPKPQTDGVAERFTAQSCFGYSTYTYLSGSIHTANLLGTIIVQVKKTLTMGDVKNLTANDAIEKIRGIAKELLYDSVDQMIPTKCAEIAKATGLDWA